MGFLHYMVFLWAIVGSWLGPIPAIFDNDSRFTSIALLLAYLMTWLTLGRFCVKSPSIQELLLPRFSRMGGAALLVIIAILSALMLRFIPSLAIILTFLALPLLGSILLNKLHGMWRKTALLALGFWIVVLIFGYAALWTTPNGLGAFTGQERAYAVRALGTEACYGLAYDNRINGSAKRVVDVEITNERYTEVEVQAYMWMRFRAETVVVAFDGSSYACDRLR